MNKQEAIKSLIASRIAIYFHIYKQGDADKSIANRKELFEILRALEEHGVVVMLDAMLPKVNKQLFSNN